MKNLKNEILKELIRLTERDYQAPPEILDALKEKLKMNPLIRYVDSLKAVNSLPPSYEVRLLNGQSFSIYYEDFSLMVKIGSKEYYLMDISERNEAIEHINKLLTIKPVPSFTRWLSKPAMSIVTSTLISASVSSPPTMAKQKSSCPPTSTCATWMSSSGSWTRPRWR